MVIIIESLASCMEFELITRILYCQYPHIMLSLCKLRLHSLCGTELYGMYNGLPDDHIVRFLSDSYK